MKKDLINLIIGLYTTFWISAFALIFPAQTIVTDSMEYEVLNIIGFFIYVLWIHVIIVDVILFVKYYKGRISIK